MSLEFRVNGPAVLYVSTGTAGAPESLAVTETGVRIGYQYFRRPLRTDVSGEAPADIHDAGRIALVSGKMVAIDPDVLDKVRARGDMTAVGQSNTVGLLFGTGEHSLTLWVDATNDRPHKFACAILDTGEDELVSSFHTQDDIRFMCWPYIAPGVLTAKDVPLFTYERPPGV